MNDRSTTLSAPARGAHASARSDERWYRRTGWRFGSQEFHVGAMVLWLVVALLPLAQVLGGGLAVPGWLREAPLPALAWLAVLGLGPVAWAWLEARAFERWASTLEPAQAATERTRHADRAATARHAWHGVLAMYAIVALLALVSRA